jgi:nuclear transport factor 2 (NTF2) superfamily protein
MKTYTIDVQRPRLVITHEESPENPREWDNVGYFYTVERKYKSPDGNTGILYDAIVEGADLVKDTENHMQLIKKIAKENGFTEKIIAIYPVYRYEHGNVVYRRGTANGWDYSNCGFYIVTEESINILGIRKSEIEKMIDQELETYTSWANGEVYQYTLYDEEENVIDACGGFYDIEDIREHLPDDWKDEKLEQYVTYE